MKNRVEGLVRQYRTARKRRLRFEAMVTALSVLVTGGVFWQLRRYGTAISDAPAAELPENGIPVVETDADPPDGTAGSGMAEEPEDWEAALPAFTDESAQQRIAAIAVSQLGYAEGSGGVLTADDGQTRTGYTRYGAWYGNPYGEWNTMFTYFCMYYAGVEKTEVPYGSGCWAWYETLDSKNMITAGGNEKTGDIIFLDMDADGEPDRTGIVSDTAETEAGLLLSVIEGNCDGAVASRQYLSGIPEILGVLSVGDYVTEDVPEEFPAGEELPAETVTLEYSGETDSGIRVEAQAAAGVFPEGAVMKAADVSDDTAMQAAADAFGGNADIREAVAVDISFYDTDGTELEPAEGASVSVQITLPEEKQLSDGVHTLVHLDDDGESAVIENADVAADGAVFENNSFSVYVISTIRTQDSVPVLSDLDDATHYYFYEDTDFGGNSADQPYIVYVGDTIEIAGDEPLNEDSNWDNAHGDHYLIPDWNYRNQQRVIKDKDGVEHTVYVSRYKAAYPGTVPVISGSDTRYFAVHEPLMVVTAYGDKQRDRIREYLEDRYTGTGVPRMTGTYFGFGLVNKDGYVPNRANRPYYLTYSDSTPNETVTFYIDSYSDQESFKFYNDIGEEITPTVSESQERIGDKYRYTVEFTADKAIVDKISYKEKTINAETGEEVTIPKKRAIRAVFSENNEEFWIRIWGDNDQNDNHADMEIADGGTYTVSSSRYEPDGTCYIDVLYYNANVTWVNDAYVYLYNGSSRHFTSEPPEPTEQYPDPIGDYEKFGEEHGTQYEYTSAWIAFFESAYKSEKHYDSIQAESALFDVNMTLNPQKKLTYKVTNGVLTLVEADENWDADPETREHLIFELNHQDVIDARNKCPLNNGLDFTVKAEFTALEMPVEKEFHDGEIEDQQFSFDVIDLNPTPLTSTREINNQRIADSASCDAEGHAMLTNMRFFEEGDYYFELRERIPEDKKTIVYDEQSYFIRVDVKKDSENDCLIAVPVFLKDNGSGNPASFEVDTDRKSVSFQNYQGYELPATGGTGPLPYLAGGILIISAASVLLLIRRRKEDEADS